MVVYPEVYRVGYTQGVHTYHVQGVLYPPCTGSTIPTMVLRVLHPPWFSGYYPPWEASTHQEGLVHTRKELVHT